MAAWSYRVELDGLLTLLLPLRPLRLGGAATCARKKASIEELARAHDEMHADPDTWPHNIAHHHAPIGGTT